MTNKKETQQQIDQARADYLAKGGKVRHLQAGLDNPEGLARKALDNLAKNLHSRETVRSSSLPASMKSKFPTISKSISRQRFAEYNKAKALERRTTLTTFD